MLLERFQRGMLAAFITYAAVFVIIWMMFFVAAMMEVPEGRAGIELIAQAIGLAWLREHLYATLAAFAAIIAIPIAYFVHYFLKWVFNRISIAFGIFMPIHPEMEAPIGREMPTYGRRIGQTIERTARESGYIRQQNDY